MIALILIFEFIIANLIAIYYAEKHKREELKYRELINSLNETRCDLDVLYMFCKNVEKAIINNNIKKIYDKLEN